LNLDVRAAPRLGVRRKTFNMHPVEGSTVFIPGRNRERDPFFLAAPEPAVIAGVQDDTPRVAGYAAERNSHLHVDVARSGACGVNRPGRAVVQEVLVPGVPRKSGTRAVVATLSGAVGKHPHLVSYAEKACVGGGGVWIDIMVRMPAAAESPVIALHTAGTLVVHSHFLRPHGTQRVCNVLAPEGHRNIRISHLYAASDLLKSHAGR